MLAYSIPHRVNPQQNWGELVGGMALNNAAKKDVPTKPSREEYESHMAQRKKKLRTSDNALHVTFSVESEERERD